MCFAAGFVGSLVIVVSPVLRCVFVWQMEKYGGERAGAGVGRGGRMKIDGDRHFSSCMRLLSKVSGFCLLV